MTTKLASPYGSHFERTASFHFHPRDRHDQSLLNIATVPAKRRDRRDLRADLKMQSMRNPQPQ
jgi:hypothetical protein